jgi:hypothetical protein
MRGGWTGRLRERVRGRRNRRAKPAGAECPDKEYSLTDCISMAVMRGGGAGRIGREVCGEVLDRELEGQGRKGPVSAMVREIRSDLPDDARVNLPTDGADRLTVTFTVPKRDGKAEA